MVSIKALQLKEYLIKNDEYYNNIKLIYIKFIY